MMEAWSLYPRGFHPVVTKHLPDLSGRAPVVARLGAWPPVKYYFVDFGISVKFPSEVESKLALGVIGLDREVPELSDTKPYDPFKVDVFILGHVYQKDIYAVCRDCTSRNILSDDERLEFL